VTDIGLRCVSALGLVAMIAIAWAASVNRRRMPWRTVLFGLGIQFALAVLLLKTSAGVAFFAGAQIAVGALTHYTSVGARFVFGPFMDSGFAIVTRVLPVIIFMGSLFSVLFFLGVIPRVVAAIAWGMRRTMGTSGAESLAAAANIFVGMVDAPLLVRPYIERMTHSELFAVMATGMATDAGSVMVAYAGMLGADYAGHLLTASLLAAPGGLRLAKVMVPETGVPITVDGGGTRVDEAAANVFDAAAIGAIAGLRLAGYVGALLIAFVALVALANDALGAFGALVGIEGLSFQGLLGIAFAPLAWLMGVPGDEAVRVGALLGVKTVLNEFIAYQDLAVLVKDGAISRRAAVLASYALCGFANFGSLAILLGGLGGMAPSRRGEIARLGLRSILAGTLATLMAGCWAGIFL
jgi:CNT family concentrative nucleoside transporter